MQENLSPKLIDERNPEMLHHGTDFDVAGSGACMADGFPLRHGAKSSSRIYNILQRFGLGATGLGYVGHRIPL